MPASMLRRWQITLNWEMPTLRDTVRLLLAGFTNVEKVTNYTGRWDVDLASYSPNATHLIGKCWEGDESQWTGKYWALLIISEFDPPNLRPGLKTYPQNPRLFSRFKIAWSSRFVQPEGNYFNSLVTVLWSTPPSPFAPQMFLVASAAIWPRLNSQNIMCEFFVQFSNPTRNGPIHNYHDTTKHSRVPTTAWTASVTW